MFQMSFGLEILICRVEFFLHLSGIRACYTVMISRFLSDVNIVSCSIVTGTHSSADRNVNLAFALAALNEKCISN